MKDSQLFKVMIRKSIKNFPMIWEAIKRSSISLYFLLTSSIAFTQKDSEFVIDITNIKAPIPASLWGLFFEDINRSADGGVYAELLKNRSFDFPEPMSGWQTWPKKVRDGIFIVTSDMNPQTKDPKWVSVNTRLTDTVGLINEGFDGIYLKKGLNYTFTLQYRQVQPGIHVRVFLLNTANCPIANAAMNLIASSKDWNEQKITLIPNDTVSRGKLLVTFEGAGGLDVDRISLFPPDTWQNRPGGLRNDLVQRLADLKPGFLRFPGGCIVEGNQLVHRYQWKNTIGPLQNRLLVQSIWADDVPDRQTPDYMESFGLGFMEYFQLCEDIGASPLPIINCGMSCQFDAAEVVPISQLEPFIQDALDLIEFANGDVNTIWGAKRAEYGHPTPFNMKMIGIGNENWGTENGRTINNLDSLWASAVIDKNTSELIIKFVNPSAKKKLRTISIEGNKSSNLNGTFIVLKGRLGDLNTLDNPNTIAPIQLNKILVGKKIKLEPFSLIVLKVKIK